MYCVRSTMVLRCKIQPFIGLQLFHTKPGFRHNVYNNPIGKQPYTINHDSEPSPVLMHANTAVTADRVNRHKSSR